MNEVEISVIEIDGERYFLVDNLVGEDNTYYYFSNIKDNKDIKVFKEDEDDFISLNERELEKALSLFYKKYKDREI